LLLLFVVVVVVVVIFLTFCFAVGRAIAAAVKAACVSSDAVTFKEDELTWGVTAADAQRLAARSFGDYKSPTRLKAEVALANYMSKFSEPRAGFIGTYVVASCIAAPGSGKSRLLDDAVRGAIAAELDANGARARSFDPRDKLLLAISFNGGTTHDCVFPVASRCVLEFFCGQPKGMRADSADSVLKKIDSELQRLLPGQDVDDVKRLVLNALEALFFHVRGAALGRTVLLVDEIALTGAAQEAVYKSIVRWIDNAPIAVGRGYLGRRGAVVTNITLWSPWDRTSESERPVVPIALGLFDVWSADVKDAILRDVQKYPRWSNVRTLPDKLWTLLASTGGRPRDIESILKSLHNSTSELERVLEDRLWHVLSEGVSPDPTFKSYLLPSMLSVQFVAGKKTQFGRQVASRALLNADLLVGGSAAVPAVPAVSLRYAECLPGGGNLRSVFPRLVRDTTFYDLRGDGKDFECVWVLLLQTHLLLQHSVRQGGNHEQFWPQHPVDATMTDGTGGRASPSGNVLQVFAGTGGGVADRETALFAAVAKNRVYQAAGSKINRSFDLDVAEPQVMLWHDLWTHDVQGSSVVPERWTATANVEWQSPALVYFTLQNHPAIDFMLLFGAAGGAGASAPHVYMFQCKARADNVTPSVLQSMVDNLDGKLDELFAPIKKGKEHPFKDHVLRRAGVTRKKQVTLCVAALHVGTFEYGEKKGIKANLPRPPKFNVVLFDARAFVGLGGAAFKTTLFMRHVEGKHISK
jgi:hypothetical protein